MTFLDQDHVRSVLESVDCSDGVDTSMMVTLKVDPLLGVIVVSLTTEHGAGRDALGRLATRSHRACVIDELIFGDDPASPAHGSVPPAAVTTAERFCLTETDAEKWRRR